MPALPESQVFFEQWQQNYVNDVYANTPRQVTLLEKVDNVITLECDELWYFAENNENKQWVWLALDRDTGQVAGAYIGDRSSESAQKLWDSLPPQYQQNAMCYTNYWQAYKAVIPCERHHSVGKETGLTNHIERFNCTLRQRVSRLVKKTLSFSKKLENHMGAIWYFIHHYNEQIRVTLAA